MKRAVRRAGQLPFYVKRGIAERREEKRSAAEQAEKKERAAVKTPSWTQKKITDFPMKPLGAVTRPVSIKSQFNCLTALTYAVSNASQSIN